MVIIENEVEKGNKGEGDQGIYIYINFQGFILSLYTSNHIFYHNSRMTCKRWNEPIKRRERERGRDVRWVCPGLSLLIMLLHIANTRWISQQSKSEMPISVCLRHSRQRETASESTLILSPIIYFSTFLLFKASNTRSKQPQCAELYKVPQRDADKSSLKIMILRNELGRRIQGKYYLDLQDLNTKLQTQ